MDLLSGMKGFGSGRSVSSSGESAPRSFSDSISGLFGSPGDIGVPRSAQGDPKDEEIQKLKEMLSKSRETSKLEALDRLIGR